jgi:hypothetical protein
MPPTVAGSVNDNSHLRRANNLEGIDGLARKADVGTIEKRLHTAPSKARMSSLAKATPPAEPLSEKEA